ncbi:hypothetical protein GQ53DRAFT_749670 [Thozetella sp. PMI_491]|nr:hypothetical protein GQ53DRAFT_749670 [Thozetella sp. PMI_491]
MIGFGLRYQSSAGITPTNCFISGELVLPCPPFQRSPETIPQLAPVETATVKGRLQHPNHRFNAMPVRHKKWRDAIVIW